MALLAQMLRRLCGSGHRQFLVAHGCALLAMLLFTAGAERASGQAASREYQLKAVLLYNLTQFTEWPGSAFPTNDSPLVIGILGVDPFGSFLDDAVRGEKSNNRRIVVKRCETVEAAKNCQILFISSSERGNLRKILPQLHGRPILTVADFDGFIRGGGMVHFFKSPENKLRLKINADAVKAINISASAKLLRVSDIVRPEEE